jgi:hypothetical protein
MGVGFAFCGSGQGGEDTAVEGGFEEEGVALRVLRLCVEPILEVAAGDGDLGFDAAGEEDAFNGVETTVLPWTEEP